MGKTGPEGYGSFAADSWIIRAMTAVFLAILSAVCGAFAHILARKMAGLTTAREMVSFNFGLMTIMLLPGAPFFWQLALEPRGLFLFMGAVCLDAVANYCYFRSFERLSAVTASSLLAFSPVFVLALAPVLGAASGGFTLWQAIGVLMAAGGLWMLAHNPNVGDQLAADKAKRVEMIWPLAAAGLFGISVYLLKTIFSQGIANPYTYYFVRAPMIAILTAVITRPNLKWVTRGSFGVTAGRLVFVIAQWLLLLYALEAGVPAVVKALGDLSPFFVVLLGWGFIREKPNRHQVGGVILIVVSMGMITLGHG